jgi:CDP-glucose 4,6-dehydratase
LQLGKRLYEGDTAFCSAWNFGPNDESFMRVEDLVKRAIGILGTGTVVVKPDDSKHETHILKLDVTKARMFLGWQPTLNFEQNIKFTFDWYKNYYEKTADMVEFTNEQINTFFNTQA